MYNLRYHIASLVAVFLALAVGLVLGSIVVERGTIDRQQAALVRGLQKDFVRINAENKILGAQVDADEEFEKALVPHVTENLLKDRTVLILTNTGRTDGLASTVDAVRDAGGEAAVVMADAKDLGLERPEVSSAATSAIGETAESELLKSIAASLTAEWTGTGSRPLTEALVDAGALRIDGLSEGIPVGAMVALASWDNAADEVTLRIAAAARDRGLPVVGAQAVGSSTRVANTFAEEGFSAVNDVGTPRGAYSLVVLLTGASTGYFGIGPATDGPFPPVPAQASD